MKKNTLYYFLLICFTCVAYSSVAQMHPTLRITLDQNSNVSRIRLIFPDLRFDLKANGQISNSFDSSDEEALSFDYYDRFDNQEKRGKLKSVGSVHIDYYDNFNGDEKKGKVKSIGELKIDYYSRFDHELQGKIKSIGLENITYYGRFDGAEKEGKLKSIGSVKIDYYGRFDGEEKAGKIKSISGNERGKVHILQNQLF